MTALLPGCWSKTECNERYSLLSGLAMQKGIVIDPSGGLGRFCTLGVVADNVDRDLFRVRNDDHTYIEIT